jgi:hypothetical protein
MSFQNILSFLFFVNILINVHANPSLEVVHAINAGSNITHTDVYGITYEMDNNSDGQYYQWIERTKFYDVEPEDTVLYQTYKGSQTALFGYNLPVNGDGNYLLILKFIEKSALRIGEDVFDVKLNGKYTILLKYDILKNVGLHSATSEAVYFEVRNQTLTYQSRGKTDVQNGTIRLDFIPKKGWAIISAIALFKFQNASGQTRLIKFKYASTEPENSVQGWVTTKISIILQFMNLGVTVILVLLMFVLFKLMFRNKRQEQESIIQRK